MSAVDPGSCGTLSDLRLIRIPSVLVLVSSMAAHAKLHLPERRSQSCEISVVGVTVAHMSLYLRSFESRDGQGDGMGQCVWTSAVIYVYFLGVDLVDEKGHKPATIFSA